MKSRHAVKQGLRCLHGVVCLKLWIHYSSNLVKRQQLRERGQEPIKIEYSKQKRPGRGMYRRSVFCSKICIFFKYSRQKEDQVGAIDVRADLVDRGGKFLLLGVVHLS